MESHPYQSATLDPTVHPIPLHHVGETVQVWMLHTDVCMLCVYSACMCVQCMCVYSVCVCQCMCVCTVYVCVQCMYVCVCVCVCVHVYVRVCVYVHVLCVCVVCIASLSFDYFSNHLKYMTRQGSLGFLML